MSPRKKQPSLQAVLDALLAEGTFLDAIALLDQYGKVLYVSPAAQRLLGYPAQELVGRFALDFTAPEERERITTRFGQTRAGQSTSDLCRIRHRDGSWRWMETLSHNFLGDPRICAIVTIFRDVTERKAAEDARNASEERYRSLVEGLDAIVWEADARTGELVFVSRGVESIAGYAPDLCRTDAHFWRSCVHPDDRGAAFACYLDAVGSGKSEGNTEFRLIAADGRVIWLRDRFHVLRDEQGRPTQLRGVMVETTGRKAREQRISVLLEMAHDLSGTLDLDELLERAQRRTARAVGLAAASTFLWNPEPGCFRLAGRPAAPEVLPPPELLSALHDGLTLVLTEPARWSWLPSEGVPPQPLEAVVAAPLLVRGRLLGMLVGTRTDRSSSFGSAEVDLLNAIAAQLAVAIESTELYRVQQEEARISGALARVGRALISALTQPDLVDQLCRLTAEALDCDICQALVWQPEEGVFVFAGVHGFSAEEIEWIRTLKIPREMLEGGLLRGLRDSDVMMFDLTGPERRPLGTLAAGYGVTGGMCTAIRSGSELVATLVTGFRGRVGTFQPAHRRICLGVVQMAWMAIQQGRLVSQLERANQLKAEFLATMSHELRTPLHIMLGYHDLLCEHLFGDLTVEQLDVLARMRRSAQGLLELVDATLDVGRLDSGRIGFEMHQVDLGRIIAEVREELAATIDERSLSFEWAPARDLPPLHTDPLKLKLILKNVVGNAVKFTRAGGVTVTAAQRHSGIEIHVTDTGIGIRPELLPLIFDAFRQGDNSITREYGGVGLGLYIARRFLEVLGGTIAVESEVARGSTFRIWLPLVAAPRYPLARTSAGGPPPPAT